MKSPDVFRHLSHPPRHQWLRDSARALALFAMLCGCGQAFATLGAGTASIDADQLALQGSQASASNGSRYSTREFILPAGTTVREYISPSSVVFAVSWNGPFIPDLKQLLGPDNFAAMSTPATSASGVASGLASGLVVRSVGRMRAFNGIAYLPSLIPSGVTVDDIQ